MPKSIHACILPHTCWKSPKNDCYQRDNTVKEENIYTEYDLYADVDCDNDEEKYFSSV